MSLMPENIEKPVYHLLTSVGEPTINDLFIFYLLTPTSKKREMSKIVIFQK